MGVGGSFVPSFSLLIFCGRVYSSHSEPPKIRGGGVGWDSQNG